MRRTLFGDLMSAAFIRATALLPLSFAGRARVPRRMG
jgi:hypothetical protein